MSSASVTTEPKAKKSKSEASSEAASPTLSAFGSESIYGAPAGMPPFLLGIQRKLTVGAVDDPLEREADRVADKVMSAHDSHPAQHSRSSIVQPRRASPTQQQPLVLQTKVDGPGSSPSPRAPLALPGERGAPLSAGVRGRVEPALAADLSHVRVHSSPQDREIAALLHAKAFTHRNHIWLGRGQSADDVALMAHEATHVVQQGAVGARPTVARKVADAPDVAAGTSTVDVQRQNSDDAMDAGAPSSATAGAGATAGGSAVDQVRAALTTPDPDPEGAGTGDFPEAFSVLNGLAMFDMLAVLDTLQATGELEVLTSHVAEAGAVNISRIRTAIITVRLAGAAEATTVGDVVELVRGMQALPPDQQTDILNYVMKIRATGIDRESLVALITAMPATNEQPTTVPGAMSPAQPRGMMAAVAPAAAALGGGSGRGAPPVGGGGGGGGPRRPQPPHLRIGNLAHRLIASYYRSAHAGDVVFTNWYSVRRLVRELEQIRGVSYNVPANTNDRSWNTQPDITNLSRPHLYEIKPTALAGLAAAEAAFYVGMFATAGVVMPLGPPGEPGTSGIIPIPPVGLFAFDSPSPGVILYGLRVRLNQQALQQQAQQGMSTGQAVGLIILTVGLVAAAVLLTIFLPPAGLAVDAALAEGVAAVGTGELIAGETALETGAVLGTEATATTAVAGEATGEAMELKSLIDLELAGEAANDNALVDVVLDEAAGF